VRVSVVQMQSGADKARNVAEMLRLLEAAVSKDGTDLAVFPEMAACLSGDGEVLKSNAERVDGPFVQTLQEAARHHSVNIVLGSFVERSGESLFNTTLLLSRSGDIVARYRKMHRFDVTIPSGTSYLESALIAGGKEIVTGQVDGVTLGLSICYDLRFPALFAKLAQKGAQVIVLPASFTFQTGADHWEVLLRARAIETQCYVVAAGQTGSFDGGKYVTFGHSMIVDPWGGIVAQTSNKIGHACAALDFDYLRTVRERMPVREHDVLGWRTENV
jgi:predicted amidohydrolase